MDATFFAFQIAVRSPPGDPWRERLVELVRRNQTDQGVFEKRMLYTQFAGLLAEAQPRWTLGTWDFVPAPRGEGEFDEWVAGLEAGVDEPLSPSAATGDHAVVTAVFLIETGSQSDVVLGARCDVQESAYFRRDTFRRLVDSLRMLTFAGVRADGLYVVPGDARSAVPLDELRGEGWDYLKPLT
jgi:hypothetical protein